MTVKIGDKLPDGVLMESREFGEACPLAPEPVRIADAVKGRKVAIIGVPGAFTPTCSAKHVPGFVEHMDAFRAAGVDEIWCVAVNDAFVMAAWGRDQDAFGVIRFLGDGSAAWTTALGLTDDRTASGMGLRMRRFSMLVDDGIVRQLNVEQGRSFEVSDAETLLRQIG